MDLREKLGLPRGQPGFSERAVALTVTMLLLASRPFSVCKAVLIVTACQLKGERILGRLGELLAGIEILWEEATY